MEPTQNNESGRSEQGIGTSAETTPVGASPSSHNTVIVAVLAVIVVVLALIYVWTTSLSQPGLPIEPMPPVTDEQPTLEPPAPVASVEQLEAELVIPELETLDAGVEQIEAEVDQALAE